MKSKSTLDASNATVVFPWKIAIKIEFQGIALIMQFFWTARNGTDPGSIGA